MHTVERSSFSTTGTCALFSDFFDFRYLNLQVESRFYLGSMNEEKGQESSALDEIMVARIEIEGIGVAANEKEMTDSVRALSGVREVKIENGAMYVTYDPLYTAEKKIEEAVRASGNTVKAATTDTETPHP
jgi:copper chaperone CopZ